MVIDQLCTVTCGHAVHNLLSRALGKGRKNNNRNHRSSSTAINFVQPLSRNRYTFYCRRSVRKRKKFFFAIVKFTMRKYLWETNHRKISTWLEAYGKIYCSDEPASWLWYSYLKRGAHGEKKIKRPISTIESPQVIESSHFILVAFVSSVVSLVVSHRFIRRK